MKDDAEYVALCDVDANVRERGAKLVETPKAKRRSFTRTSARRWQDKDIDAITIATPNHWHTLGGDLGLPGGQGCLCREAAFAQHL